MWKEFEGKLVFNPDGTHTFAIKSERPLQKGEEITLFQQQKGLLRKRIVARKSIKILDDDNVVLKSMHLNEPVVNGGYVKRSDEGYFGFALEDYERETGSTDEMVGESQVINRQDVWVRTKHDTDRGIMYVDAKGERKDVEFMRPGRSFYFDDPDELDEELRINREEERKEAEGKIETTEIASIGGITLAISQEIE